jgi:hypothetical protein
MKKSTFIAFVLTVFAINVTIAQSNVAQNLDYAMQSSENIQEEVFSANNAMNQLSKEIVILGNPNATLFESRINDYTNQIVNLSDEIIDYVALASNETTISFSTLEIEKAAKKLVYLNKEITILKMTILNAIENNNNEEALQYVSQLRRIVNCQNDKSVIIIEIIEGFKKSVKPYKVCIQAIDNNGNATVYSAGFYCYNTATGAYIYPDSQDGSCFLALSPGNYTFDSYDDYFCGTSSSNVTLSRNLENVDGVIVVNLTVWCE